MPMINNIPPPPQDGSDENFQEYAESLCRDYHDLYLDLVDPQGDDTNPQKIKERVFVEFGIEMTPETAQRLAEKLEDIKERHYKLPVTDTTIEAAKKIGVSPNQLLNWFRTGREY